ncbi:DNA polymerase III subunit alpha [Olivibacter sp. LS-1]|uniref:error-prone DNA polymerase n=1 Tax=Olivibacter sp. LS-1 TaxID=2592345 RepID=UPI0011EABFAA|nr:error-prone DNA polymerase [Olivibacter sp. LS-1]QEL01876.1 DNA polymerase III subunit alpha [Olivibacter sp. LS-1]
MADYTELQVTTNFSFLRGASHPEELIEQAALYGYKTLAITDRNSLAGIVRGHVAAKAKGIRIIPACRLDLLDGPSLLAYPTDMAAYGRLSTLLSTGNLRAEKGACHLCKMDVYAFKEGIKFVIVPPDTLNDDLNFERLFIQNVEEYRIKLGKDLYLAITRSYTGDDMKKIYRLSQLANRYDIPLIATNDVYYHSPDRRELQDILTCIREKCTIYNAGFRLHQNAERHLKSSEEMERIFRQYPDAILRTQEIVEACQFSLDTLKYVYPEEITEEGRSPLEELTHLAWLGAKKRYGETIPDKIKRNIAHELGFIEEMNYAAYFLTVYDLVRYANEQGILCQGRGSAANSTICYCLGITAINPEKFDLLFERFISSARNEPPDIDVDFEHERREEIIQYIYRKYGRDRAAIVATVTQVHEKGAIRDVGKAMGLSVDTINRLAKSIWEFTPEWFDERHITEYGFDARDPHLRKVLQLTQQYVGFPRQLGQHTGGFVITQGKLSHLCPILNARMEDRTCIEWNKDDIEALGFLKIDVLALGMLTCIRKAFNLVKQHKGIDLSLANISIDEKNPKVYAMISRADTIGVFQIESRAQQSMLPRLRPENFYDLVIEVAIVRPGPIQGDMVHPFLRRRREEEAVEYPSPALEEILKRTLGVPLFQEQAMKIAMVAAGFTAAEADELRRSMATFKAKGTVTNFEEKLIQGMVRNGYTLDFAKRIFKQLEGFGSYGFPESHAASFALLVYVSAWIKCYHPEVFACALLNSMPMGFYQPAQIVIDAEKHGVTVLPVDVNYSYWDNSLEEKIGEFHAMRLGFRQVKGLREDEVAVLIDARKKTTYTCIHSIWKIGVLQVTLEKLADADAFQSLGLDRRQALWQISLLRQRPKGLFIDQGLEYESKVQIELPKMTAGEHVLQDYASMSLSLKAHPVSFVREKLRLLHVLPAQDLAERNDGVTVKVAGLVLVRQRPGTASGICFITLEDETGCSNLVVFQKLFEKYRKEILRAKLLMVEGKLQREGEVVHVIVRRCFDLSRFLGLLTAHETNKELGPIHDKESQIQNISQKKIFPEGRNFK